MFTDNCTEYFEKDLIVIPLRGKIPVIHNWSRFAEQFPSELLISMWENKHKRKNIGLLLGKLTNVVAVDLDYDKEIWIKTLTDKGKKKEEIQIILKLAEEALKNVPPSPVAKKGKKGETRFFKYNGEVNFKRHDLGIEMLSTGNQTVLPPSIHPETNKPYFWTTPDTLLSYDIEDLPVLPESFFKALDAFEVVKGDTTGRHNKLVDIVSAMIERGETSDECIREMTDYDNENHSPPYFTDETEPHKGTGYTAALKLYTSLVTTIQRKGKMITPSTLEIKIGTKEVEKLIEQSENKKTYVKFPKPTGILKELTDHILARSHKPRVKFAMASAMGLIGTILSNKVKYKDSTPNLYQLMIAESGEGKEAPIKAPRKILIEMKFFKYVGLDQYRGDKSIVKKFETQRERIDTIDEVSKLFRAVNSTSNIFMSGMAETLTEIWNSSGELFMGMSTSESTVGMVFNPCLTFMGGTTPDAFSNTFSSANLMQGFGGRFLYVFDDRKTNLVEPPNFPMTDELRNFIIHWAKKYIVHTKIDMSETGSFNEDKQQIKELEKPNPVDLPCSEDAKKYLEETMHYFHEMGYHCDKTVKPIVLRAYQQTKKIMIISACCNSPIQNPAPLIQKSDVEFARKYVEASIKQTTTFFAENLIMSKFHRESQKVLAVLKSKKKGMTRSELTKALRRDFRASELYDKKQGLITNLIEAEKIFATSQINKETKKKVLIFFYNFSNEDS